jgi:hypothetical protein
MQLRQTRLCLDCEELHRADRCPICASEAFVYLTRWIPADERRSRRREEPAPTAPTPPAHAPGMSRWLARGAAGLVLVATGRWLWNSVRPMQWSETPHERREPAKRGGRDS